MILTFADLKELKTEEELQSLVQFEPSVKKLAPNARQRKSKSFEHALTHVLFNLSMLTQVAARNGRRKYAEQCLEAYKRLLGETDSTMFQAQYNTLKAKIEHLDGKLHEAERLYQEVLKDSEPYKESDPEIYYMLQNETYLNLLELIEETGAEELESTYRTQALDAARKLVQISPEVHSKQILLNTLNASLDSNALLKTDQQKMEILEEALDLILSFDDPNALGPLNLDELIETLSYFLEDEEIFYSKLDTSSLVDKTIRVLPILLEEVLIESDQLIELMSSLYAHISETGQLEKIIPLLRSYLPENYAQSHGVSIEHAVLLTPARLMIPLLIQTYLDLGQDKPIENLLESLKEVYRIHLETFHDPENLPSIIMDIIQLNMMFAEHNSDLKFNPAEVFGDSDFLERLENGLEDEIDLEIELDGESDGIQELIETGMDLIDDFQFEEAETIFSPLKDNLLELADENEGDSYLFEALSTVFIGLVLIYSALDDQNKAKDTALEAMKFLEDSRKFGFEVDSESWMVIYSTLVDTFVETHDLFHTNARALRISSREKQRVIKWCKELIQIYNQPENKTDPSMQRDKREYERVLKRLAQINRS